MSNRDVYCVVAAAGNSSRMGAAGDKLMRLHGGEPVVRWSVKAMLDAEPAGVVVVAPKEKVRLYADMLADLEVQVVEGGDSRHESVERGLLALPEAPGCYVLVHDGARPFASSELVQRVIDGARQYQACVPVLGQVDTMYRTFSGQVTEVLPREQLGAAQTPQGFALDLLRKAYERAMPAGAVATDEGSLVLALSHPVAVIPGERRNIKLTTPEDLQMLKFERAWRVGTGYDVHRFAAGRRLILGGVHVPCDRGLLGHSDADVLAHAIMDALLGAMGLGDIGMHFPDNSELYKDADSLQLLTKVRDLLVSSGAQIENVDATLILEEPRLSPYKDEMRFNIARALALDASQVGVKATTNERMGHIGRGEGVCCQAVVSVSVEGKSLAQHSKSGI